MWNYKRLNIYSYLLSSFPNADSASKFYCIFPRPSALFCGQKIKKGEHYEHNNQRKSPSTKRPSQTNLRQFLNPRQSRQGQEIIEEKIDLLKYGLQKEIVEERCTESGKPKHTNDLARKSELTMREQSHEPLRMLKADRLCHIETTKQLQALIEFQKRQFVIGEKMLGYLANNLQG